MRKISLLFMAMVLSLNLCGCQLAKKQSGDIQQEKVTKEDVVEGSDLYCGVFVSCTNFFDTDIVVMTQEELEKVIDGEEVDFYTITENEDGQKIYATNVSEDEN